MPTQKSHRRNSSAGRHRVRNLVLGTVFLLLGLIGILIPVMPQLLFFALSFFFFSLAFPPLQRWFQRFLRRHPRVAEHYERWRKKADDTEKQWKKRWEELRNHLGKPKSRAAP
jgi:uncharacterized membrane protein YbaN (DUF454 family)